MKPGIGVHRGWVATGGLSVVLFAVVSLLSTVPFVREWQIRLSDTFFQVAPIPRHPSPVTVVIIDDRSLQQYGRWPWSRELLAKMTEKLAAAGAGPIGFDILLSEPQSADVDQHLAKAFQAAGHVVLVDKISNFADGPGWVEPLAAFSQSAPVGHAQAVLDLDSICRRFPPRELSVTGSRWAFAVEVARQTDQKRASEFLSAYGVPVTDDASRVSVARPVLVRIPFRRDGVPTISAGRILGEFDPKLVAGRPILVGFGSTEIGDRLSTPLSTEVPVPGVEVHAQILDGILTGRRLFDLPLWGTAVIVLLTCMAAVFVFRKGRRPTVIAVLVLACCALVYSVCVAVFLVFSRFAPVGPMMLATVLAPSLVYTAEFVAVDRSLARQLRSLRAFLAVRKEVPMPRGSNLSWRLELLQNLQTELGSLYELHRVLLESTQDLVAIFDVSGKLLLKNQPFSTALRIEERGGFSLGELRAELKVSEDAPLVTIEGREEGEVYLEGQLYSLRVAPLPPTSVSPAGGTIVTLVSLRTRVERDRARAEALGFITHELRTPLASIHGFADMIRRDPATPESEGAAETIYRETKRLLALISSYLDVLRLDAGAKPLTTHIIDLESLVLQVFEILQPLANQAGMTLMFESPEPITLMGDAPLITGAILNLVSNAIKYGRAGTEIKVSCRASAHEVVASVRNVGQPISNREIPRLFDPYYRATAAENSKTGWGLGLAFVKRIVEKHGGSVKVISANDATVFEMHLPNESEVQANVARSTL